MVSGINSVRIWTQQAALKAFQETSSDTDNGAAGSSLGSLADLLYEKNDHDEADDTALSSLISRLQQQAMTGGATPVQDIEGSVDDISSNAFMKALQQKIDLLAASPDTKAMADAIQAALDAGTLTVTDVVAGEQITGRALPDRTGGGEKAGNADSDGSPNITPVQTSDWSTYLREHLKRDPYGKYIRNGDTSHIDKVSGASSYFGMIDETYYYLSWTTPKPTGAVTIQA